MKAAVTTLLALLTACSSTPPVRIETPHGVVRARTQAEAELVADALVCAPEVRDGLESTRADLPVVWVVERTLGGAHALCFKRRIELTPEAASHPYYLAHELGHWYADESPYAGLPHFVEEGLAEFVALDLLGLVEARRRELDKIGDITVTSAMLHADELQWFTLTNDDHAALIRLGFAVVSRVSLDRLQALAAAEASPRRYLDDAGLRASQ